MDRMWTRIPSNGKVDLFYGYKIRFTIFEELITAVHDQFRKFLLYPCPTAINSLLIAYPFDQEQQRILIYQFSQIPERRWCFARSEKTAITYNGSVESSRFTHRFQIQRCQFMNFSRRRSVFSWSAPGSLVYSSKMPDIIISALSWQKRISKVFSGVNKISFEPSIEKERKTIISRMVIFRHPKENLKMSIRCYYLFRIDDPWI